MEILFLYSFKVIICTGILLGYYYLFLKDKTFHHYNRFYLLSALPISLLIPFIKIENFTIEVNENIYVLIERMQRFNLYENPNHHENVYDIMFWIVIFISFLFLAKLLFGIFKIHQLKKQFQKEEIQEINFYRTDLTDAPFSYFKNLFWKNSISLQSEVGKQILKHEMVHIEQKHSIDKIIVEIVASAFWFNPFYHSIKKELSLIHEYLADNKSVKQSDTKAFAEMILTSHLSYGEWPATNPFLSSNLKKRLTMLQKPKTKYGYTRRLFALPLVCTIVFVYMVNAKNKEIIQTNIEINKAVFQIEKDTINPQTRNSGEIKRKTENLADKNISEVKINKEDPENEYAQFYNEAENKRLQSITKKKEAQLELTKIIESNRKELAFDEKFPKNRDYDKNPLTNEEKKELKEDADKIAKLSEEKISKRKLNFGLFKVEKSMTKVFDINGNEIKTDHKSPVGNVNLMSISVDGAELFVNGKKVPKEEFLKYQTDFKNDPDVPANIKLFKIERIGDQRISYAKKMEIITN